MSEPVYLSNFLRQASWGGVLLGHDEVDALLAYGGGDPVVIMPDGRLMRLVYDEESEADRDWAHQYQPIDPGETVPDWPIYKLTDPVQP